VGAGGSLCGCSLDDSGETIEYQLPSSAEKRSRGRLLSILEARADTEVQAMRPEGGRLVGHRRHGCSAWAEAWEGRHLPEWRRRLGPSARCRQHLVARPDHAAPEQEVVTNAHTQPGTNIIADVQVDLRDHGKTIVLERAAVAGKGEPTARKSLASTGHPDTGRASDDVMTCRVSPGQNRPSPKNADVQRRLRGYSPRTAAAPHSCL
jgi:hypothetical protein